MAQVLRPLLDSFRPEEHPRLLVGVTDDAAVYKIDEETALVQTVDFFPPVVDDPWTYGAIAAANAMSDVYAMGGEVALALNVAAFPEDLPIEVMREVFRGGADKVAEAGGIIVGGHTIIDAEPKYGLSVTGFVHPQRILRKAGAQVGDAVVMTKPIGTGIVLTAAKRDIVEPSHLEAAVASMLLLNRHAAHLAREAGVHALTDVTGFAIAGHGLEIAEASGVQIAFQASALPLLPGAIEYARLGVDFGGVFRNIDQLGERVRIGAGVSEELRHLIYDPQTSGALLIVLPAANAEALVEALRRDGHPAAAVVGEVRAGAGVLFEG